VAESGDPGAGLREPGVLPFQPGGQVLDPRREPGRVAASASRQAARLFLVGPAVVADGGGEPSGGLAGCQPDFQTVLTPPLVAASGQNSRPSLGIS
jgi:hypothetical protein